MQQLAGREGGEVLGDVNAALVEFEQFDLFFLLSGAEDDAEWRLLTGLLLILGEPAEVEFHLAFVFGLEVTQFQIDGDEAFEGAVVEEEVEVEVVGVDLDASLATEKGEAVAELEQEGFELAEDGVFEILLWVAVL